jgi:hypothetical protein
MKKTDTKQAMRLIMEAPIGQYIGEDGAQILAERACCEISLKDNEFLFHQGDLENSFYIVTEGRLSLVKERKKDQKPLVLHVLEKGDLVFRYSESLIINWLKT